MAEMILVPAVLELLAGFVLVSVVIPLTSIIVGLLLIRALGWFFYSGLYG